MGGLRIHNGKAEIYNKGKRRDIGRISREGDDVVFTKTTSDIFRKLHAFGFCAEAIEVINPDIMRVKYNGGYLGESNTIFEISREDYHRHKTYLKFEGSELQEFVKIMYFRRLVKA